MQIERTDSKNLLINGLPDGSRVIVDAQNEKVYALNATAGAAWDACSGETTLSQVAEKMRRSCGPTVTDEIAEQAIVQLEEKELVKTSGFFSKTSRRDVLAGIGAVALPLVVSMTLADQRALAQSAQSNTDPGGCHWDRPEAHVSRESNERL
jgi:uncharacterized protein with NAD-binding domain and iron-sulfur cluster